ncbi:unnamed protein product, partial [Coccothraustes coccothraustes]
MDPLTLTLLAVTAMTATAASVPSSATTATPLLAVPLDMAPDSFDDQYRGCGRAMAAELPALNRSEFQRGGHLAEGWALAAAQWRVRPSPGSPGSPLSPAQATALLAYTAPVPLHRTFNEAVRAGRALPPGIPGQLPLQSAALPADPGPGGAEGGSGPAVSPRVPRRARGAVRGAPRGHRALRPLRVGLAAQRELLELRHRRGLPGAHLPGRGHPGILLLPARGGGADPALRDLRGHRCHQRHRGRGQGADPAPLHRDLQQLQLRVAARAALRRRALCVRHRPERPQCPPPPRGAPPGHHSPGSGHRNLL